MRYVIRMIVVAAAVLVFAPFAEAQAPAPTSLGVCFNVKSGEVKVAASAQACKNQEQFVSIPLTGGGERELVRADHFTQSFWGGPDWVTVTCPAGKKVISGNHYIGFYQPVSFYGGFIHADRSAFTIEISGNGWASAFAICE